MHNPTIIIIPAPFRVEKQELGKSVPDLAAPELLDLEGRSLLAYSGLSLGFY